MLTLVPLYQADWKDPVWFLDFPQWPLTPGQSPEPQMQHLWRLTHSAGLSGWTLHLPKTNKMQCLQLASILWLSHGLGHFWFCLGVHWVSPLAYQQTSSWPLFWGSPQFLLLPFSEFRHLCPQASQSGRLMQQPYRKKLKRTKTANVSNVEVRANMVISFNQHLT